MEFNSDNKVIIDSMTKTEARAFCKFLTSEVYRHIDDITQSITLMEQVMKKFKIADIPLPSKEKVKPEGGIV